MKLRRAGYTRSITSLYRVKQREGIYKKTPRHNGKVERSHRKDQERFYYNKVFWSFEDFKNRLKYWEKEYNNFPMKPLGWKSPNEKLKEREKNGLTQKDIATRLGVESASISKYELDMREPNIKA